MAVSKHNRMTVADLRAAKGKRQLAMLFAAEIEVVPARVAYRCVFSFDNVVKGNLFDSYLAPSPFLSKARGRAPEFPSKKVA